MIILILYITFFKGVQEKLPVAIHAFANCERSSNLRKRVLRSLSYANGLTVAPLPCYTEKRSVIR